MLRPALAFVVALLAATEALALYKVVGPDGRVTYTDRPPPSASGRVTSIGRSGAAEPLAEGATLPIELRQAMARFPVTLYTTADCAPCESGRQLLQQRGVPYSERRVASDDDALALERLAGGRTVPTLTVGSQVLRGLATAEWTAYLDAAGYPRESRLPRNWQPPAATPLVERSSVVPRNPALPTPPPEPEPPEPPASEPSFRF